MATDTPPKTDDKDKSKAPEEPTGAALRNADDPDERVDESYLIANARALFGVRPSRLTGALATSGRKTSSPKEAREALKAFGKLTVPVDQGTPQAEEE